MTRKTAEPIEFEAKGETFSLKMGFAAVIKMEEVYGKGFYEIAAEVFNTQMRMGDMLTIFHACMHQDRGTEVVTDVTRDEAAAIVDELGVDKVSALIAQAVDESPLFKAEEKPTVRGAGPKRTTKAKAG